MEKLGVSFHSIEDKILNIYFLTIQKRIKISRYLPEESKLYLLFEEYKNKIFTTRKEEMIRIVDLDQPN